MIGRWIVLAAFALAGGFPGWWLASHEGLAWGLLLGAVGWQLMDSFYARRLLNWLRSEQSNESPVLMAGSQPRLPGVWGEAADRVRRLLKNRHEQSRESQARLDELLAALQTSPNGVVLLDEEGRIEWCNQTAAQHFGFDAKRDLQQHIANLVRDPAFSAYLTAASFSHEVVIPGNFSTVVRPIRLSVHAHRYGKEKKLLLSRDITALEQAEAMRRDFVANVSHEIRTPLTVVAGFIETLQNLPLKKPDRNRYLALMAQQSQRIQSLVDDLLTLSRLEGSPLPGTQEWTATASLFAQCEQEARALSGLMSPQGHQLLFDAGPASDISGIGRELISALSNLVTNAVRYTPESGLIRVTWTLLPDGRGRFCVRDSGPGIAAEHLPRLTERFYRVDRSRSRETGGTGLGLAIVKHVAQRHGAELKIESHVGQGSCFCIIFPAARIRRQLQPA
ncbi:phosphate regulon sensor histidine kinase PhoR [Polaromonas sp. DSR2-3-2]|uniref:phosphate regulon sensor histidine kinase PhoR n=1 Tax=unclassified Polaromonas TaxID=2638319 RepID=UPI003CF76969